MAIDSATKRASALSFGNATLRLIPPDGTVNDEDRQTLAGMYSLMAEDLPGPMGGGRRLWSVTPIHLGIRI